jgi:hypothetical protein
LSIDGGTFRLNANGITTTISNLTDAVVGAVSGVIIATNGSNERAVVTPTIVALVNSLAGAVATLKINSNAGELFLLNSVGLNTITLIGSTGAATVRTLTVGESANTGSFTWKGPTATVAYAGVQSIPSLCDGFIRVTIDGIGVRRIPYFLDTGGL